MKYAEFPQVTRITVVGKNGVALEDYNLFKEGAEIHLQDGGRTLKVFPLTDLPISEGGFSGRDADAVREQGEQPAMRT